MTIATAAPDATELAARHAEVYASGRVPAFVHWKVAARLRAGRNPLSELDVVALAGLGITDVLDLREEREWDEPGLHGREAIAALARHGIARANVPIPDYHAPRAPELAAAVGFVAEVLAGRKRRLYVHCRAGIERSGTILAAWRSWSAREPFGVALWSVRRYGWPAAPQPHQQRAAEEWLEARRHPAAAGEK